MASDPKDKSRQWQNIRSTEPYNRRADIVPEPLLKGAGAVSRAETCRTSDPYERDYDFDTVAKGAKPAPREKGISEKAFRKLAESRKYDND